MEMFAVLLFVVIFVLFFIAYLKLKRLGGGPAKQYPYEQIGYLFSAAERSFYGVLVQAVENKAVVFGKVRVADVLQTRKGLDQSARATAFNRISKKHFDFILCRPDDLSIIAAVELDDASHNSKKRIDRDEFLNEACIAANLKLHHFKASKSYNISDVRNLLFSVEIAEADSNSSLSRLEPQHEVTKGSDDIEPARQKLCPKCQSPMVQKIAKKGSTRGNAFFACSAFPKCRYIQS